MWISLILGISCINIIPQKLVQELKINIKEKVTSLHSRNEPTLLSIIRKTKNLQQLRWLGKTYHKDSQFGKKPPRLPYGKEELPNDKSIATWYSQPSGNCLGKILPVEIKLSQSHHVYPPEIL